MQNANIHNTLLGCRISFGSCPSGVPVLPIPCESNVIQWLPINWAIGKFANLLNLFIMQIIASLCERLEAKRCRNHDEEKRYAKESRIFA
jgi:hypothetical protein